MVNTQTPTVENIYNIVKEIENISMEQFSTEYCEKSGSYLRVLKNKQQAIPQQVLIRIVEKLLERQQLKRLTQKKAVIDAAVRKILRIIATTQTASSNRRIREMLVKIITEINEEQYPTAMPIIIC